MMIDESPNPYGELDEQLGYDADHSDSSQYCRHGTFIGSWWGPDYLCFYCETGEEPPTEQELEEIQQRKVQSRIDSFDKVVQVYQEFGPWNPTFAQSLMDLANDPYFFPAR